VECTAIRAVGNAQVALRCGITSALDVGSRGQAVVQDGLPGPALRVSGQIQIGEPRRRLVVGRLGKADGEGPHRAGGARARARAAASAGARAGDRGGG